MLYEVITNGAGKTTTFYMTVGMIRPEKGRVHLGGEDITQYPMYIRARKGIGYLPQESSIFKKLTVRENITAILEVIDNVITSYSIHYTKLYEPLIVIFPIIDIRG